MAKQVFDMDLSYRKFYLAGPINHEKEVGYEWRDKVAKELKHSGAIVNDPKEFEPGENYTEEQLVELDKRKIRSSEIIIANLTDLKDNVSIGTPMEIMYASQLNKTLLTIDMEWHNWIKVHSDIMYHSFDEFMDRFFDPNETHQEVLQKEGILLSNQ